MTVVVYSAERAETMESILGHNPFEQAYPVKLGPGQYKVKRDGKTLLGINGEIDWEKSFRCDGDHMFGRTAQWMNEIFLFVIECSHAIDSRLSRDRSRNGDWYYICSKTYQGGNCIGGSGAGGCLFPLVHDNDICRPCGCAASLSCSLYCIR